MVRSPVVALLVVVSGCYRIVDLGLPDVASAGSIFLETEQGVVAADLSGPRSDLVATEHPTAALYSHQTLEALLVDPGLLPEDRPRRVPAFRHLAWRGGAWQDAAGEGSLDLPALDAKRCLVELNGCFAAAPPEPPEDRTNLEPQWCKVPCESPEVAVLELPDVPAARVPVLSAEVCPAGTASFVPGEPCLPLGGPCDATPPPGAVVVEEGAVGGTGAPDQPLGTLEEALVVAPASAVIFLRRGTYLAPPVLDGVTLAGECAGETVLEGRPVLFLGRLERLTMPDGLEVRGDAELIGVELWGDLFIHAAEVRLNDVAIRGAVLSLYGDSTVTAVRLAASGAVGHRCGGLSNVDIESARFEEDGSEGTLLAVEEECFLRMTSSYLRGGERGILAAGKAAHLQDVQIGGMEIAIEHQQEALQLADILLHDVERGIVSRDGLLLGERVVVTDADIGIRFAAYADGMVARARFERVALAASAEEWSRLVLHGASIAGPSGGVLGPSLQIGESTRSSSLSGIYVRGAGPIVLGGNATAASDLRVEEPVNEAFLLQGDDVRLERVEVRSGSEHAPAIRIQGGSAALEDLRLVDGSEGIVVKGDPSVDLFSFVIEGFDVGLRVEEGEHIIMSDGELRENVVALDLPNGVHPPLNVRFVDNETLFR